MWDAIYVETLAPSHRVLTSTEAEAVTNEAENHKKLKYSHLELTHVFVPVMVETLHTLILVVKLNHSSKESGALYQNIHR